MWKGSVIHIRRSSRVKENRFDSISLLKQTNIKVQHLPPLVDIESFICLEGEKKACESLEVRISIQYGISLIALVMSCVVSYPEHKAVWEILCLGKSTCALWPYWWRLVGCNGGRSLGRPGRERQTCWLQLHSGQKPELVENKITMSLKHELAVAFYSEWDGWLAEKPAMKNEWH